VVKIEGSLNKSLVLIEGTDTNEIFFIGVDPKLFKEHISYIGCSYNEVKTTRTASSMFAECSRWPSYLSSFPFDGQIILGLNYELDIFGYLISI
jgi:hypothetical protein